MINDTKVEGEESFYERSVYMFLPYRIRLGLRCYTNLLLMY